MVGPALARALIRTQFPTLAAARLRPLGVGFDNTVYLVDRRWVFRFPRRAIAAAVIPQVAALLPAVARWVPLPVPAPVWIGRPVARFPWPFIGHAYLPGRDACRAAPATPRRAALGEAVGRFLARLHAFPLDEARRRGAPGDELRRLDVQARLPGAAVALHDLEARGLLSGRVRRRLEAILEETPDASPGAALVHGDLYARHLLVAPDGRAAGVIDWDDVHVGGPAVDLAVAFTFLPARARAPFWRAYGEVDPATRGLARFRAICHAAATLRYADRAGDRALAREARRALHWALED